MLESSHIKIEVLKILQLEKERLVDIRGKLSQERITPEEENACLNELEKTSERWRQTSRQLEPLPIANMTVERFLNIIQSARAQMTPKDRKTVVRDIEARIREINDEMCKLKYQVSVELDREQSPGQAMPEAQNTASTPQTPAGATGNPTPEANQRPQGKNKRKINKLFYTFDGKGRIELSSDCKHTRVALTEQETKLLLYLKEDRRTPDEIIEYIWDSYKQKDLRMKRKNVKELRGRLNKKCSKMGVDALISKLTGEYYSLNDIEVVER